MILLGGKAPAERVYNEIQKNILNWREQNKRVPHLAVVLVGDDPASQVYVSHKQKACEKLGYKSSLIQLPSTTREEDLAYKINQLNSDIDVDAILLQLPLPSHLDSKKMSNLISDRKDADSLTTASLGKLMAAQNVVASCTPAGIMEILDYNNIDVSGKNVLVIGRSLIVGLPLFHLLNQKNATVTVAHSRTDNLKAMVKNYDLVFVAVGKPHFLKATDFKKDAVVIDVGIHRSNASGEKKLIGDVDPIDAENWLKALTPVPGGVGPMTIAMLMWNTFKLAELSRT